MATPGGQGIPPPHPGSYGMGPGMLPGSPRESVPPPPPPNWVSGAGPAGPAAHSFPTPPTNAALQDHQIQLMLLEQQNKKRLMMTRQEQDMVMGIQAESRAPAQAQAQAQSSVPETHHPHYTISEDEVGIEQQSNLAAFKSDPDVVEAATTSAMSSLPSNIQEQATQQQRLQHHQQAYQQRQKLMAQHAQALAQSNHRHPTHPAHPGLGQLQIQVQGSGRIPGANRPTRSQFGSLTVPNMFTPPPPPTSGPPFGQGVSIVQVPKHSAPSTSGVLPTMSTDSGSQLEILLSYVRDLENKLGIPNTTLEQAGSSAINIQYFHCVGERDDYNAYLSEPVFNVCDGEVMLKGFFPIHDPDGYIEKKGNITFVVYKYYSTNHQQSKLNQAMKAKEALPNPEPASQDVRLVSAEMIDAMQAFIAVDPDFCVEFPEVDGKEVMNSPFVWWYHHRKLNGIRELSPRQAELVTSLTSWIEASYGSLYDKIDDQFQRVRVSSESLEYLVRPGHVLVLNDNPVLPTGHIATSRPGCRSCEERGPQERSKAKYKWSWTIRARSYIYVGTFGRKEDDLTLHFETDTEDGEVDIGSLNIMPLEHATDHVKERLESRGKTFWKCRGKQLISYAGSMKSKDNRHAGQRFMTDFDTYKELHPSNRYLLQKPLLGYPHFSSARPGVALPTDGSEPTAPEIYLFPTHLPGFDLRRKKWVDLEVDRIRDVVWNDQAFRSLVADEDMKQLVLALVTNQLASDTGTDLIDNKGNGLIILLHGPPGTGKTFTAESVAEIAKKPLYSVTCGDIGTDPESVEKYLASVFHLGKIWDCVVLLDEAEVFLEQRTLQDLNRNALVSVFLRALEYYEGILILTTNRVGSFDGAFKSRIQLALRYEKLRHEQRKQVWRNFVERLRSLREGGNIDFDDVEEHIDELAAQPMNGREIRNSITTGRQLAKFMKERMTSEHLKRAIGVAEKFDRYLAEEKDGDGGAGGAATDGDSEEYFS